MTTTMNAPSKLDRTNRIALVWSWVIIVFMALVLVFGLILFFGRGLFAMGSETQMPNLVTGAALTAFAVMTLNRYRKVLTAYTQEQDEERLRQTMKVDLVQGFLLFMLATVLFPVLWIVAMSLDPRDFSRPTGLTIVPPGASLQAYIEVLTKPSPNDVTFLQLLRNSLLVAGGTAALSVVVGTSAAYAFSRLKFPGRRAGMLGFVLVLMMPAGATLAPLFVLLNTVGLRSSLWGLAIAYTSTALPFSIWNMKGFIDSLPYELEEAAQIDGCSRTESFIRVILPLAVPGMAVTALQGFLTGWSEFILAWTFLTEPTRFTLPMVLRGMTGQYASGTPWANFAAMSILMSIPPIIFFFFLQRYLVSGLAVGGVKG